MRSFHGRILVIISVLALAVLAMAGHAQQVSPTAQLHSDLIIGASGVLLLPQRGQQPLNDSIGGPGAQSTCSATCVDGSTVSCYGSTCSAYDANCSSGLKGYCTGSGSGRRDCTASCPTPTCAAFAICPNGTKISCHGSSAGGCESYQGCWVACDGQYTYCPGVTNCPV